MNDIISILRMKMIVQSYESSSLPLRNNRCRIYNHKSNFATMIQDEKALNLSNKYNTTKISTNST